MAKKRLVSGEALFGSLLIDSLMWPVKEALSNMFQKQFDDLVRRNFDRPEAVTAVRFNGEKFRTSAPMRTGSLLIEPAEVFRSQDAFDEMNEILQWRNTENMKLKMVSQIIGRLIADCKTDQEVRNALPDSIASFLGSATIKNLPRTVPWLSGIDNPMLLAQAKGLEDQADYLSALTLVN